MVELASRKLPRGTLFIAFNAAVMILFIAFVLGPVFAHFADRSEEISEGVVQLAALRRAIDIAKSSATRSSPATDPFLPGNEDRVVSADLQATLKSVASNAGLAVLSLRSTQPSRGQHLTMIAVEVELEGSMSGLRQMLAAIERQTPFLFVTAATFRSVTQGDDGIMRADMKVQGAMHARSVASSTRASNP